MDLTIVLDTDRPEQTSLPDCVSGFGPTPEAKRERAVQMWATTTGAAVLEMPGQRGRHGAHFPAEDPDGFPGRHAFQGGIVGWGAGPEHSSVQRWAADRALLRLIAPALTADRPRPPSDGSYARTCAVLVHPSRPFAPLPV